MKKFIFAMFLSMISAINYAQSVKYGELIEMVKQAKYEKAYSLLYEFQAKNPDFANTYFHLGNISFKWAKNSDPRIDYNVNRYYIYNTKLFYSLGIAKITKQSRDARRNDEYYKTIPEFKGIKRLENQMVIDYMNKQVADIKEFDEKTAEIVNYFHSLIRTYSKTQIAFNNFITANENINTILTQPDKPTLETTNEIINLYDSTLYYHQLYKNALINYPLKGANQVLIEKPIKTYRLQGLTGTNFLADTIFIWNYKKWAQDIQKELNSNITHFRKTIEKTNKKISTKNTELSKATKSSNAFKPLFLDQIVSFEIEKYDYNSIISSLFKYRTAKINYLVHSLKTFNSRNDFSYKPLLRATEYYKLSLMKLKIDSLLKELNSKTNNANYMKHKYFFDNNYNGIEGLRSFINKQNNDNTERYARDLTKFNYFIFRDIYMQTIKPEFVMYKNKEIALNVQLTPIEKAENNQYYTLAAANYNNTKYVSGYYKSAAVIKAFVAKIVDSKVEWLKMKAATNKAIAMGVKIAAGENSCFWILHSIKNEAHKNQIIQLSADGKEVYKKDLSNTAMPCLLQFDDINSDVLTAFKGLNLNYSSEKYNAPLEIKKINTLTNEISIDKTIVLNGNLVNIIKINSDYYLFANYTKLGYDQNIITNNIETIGLIKFSELGEFSSVKQIKPKKNVWASYALKINDKTISITALTKKTDMYNSKFNKLPKMYNLIINPNGKILYENYASNTNL